MLHLVEADSNGVAILAERRAVGNEAGAVVDHVHWNGLGRDSDDRRTGDHVLRHHAVRADLRALADGDRPKHLRARADHDARTDRRMALSALAGRWVGA